jgi:hypothetical protein
MENLPNGQFSLLTLHQHYKDDNTLAPPFRGLVRGTMAKVQMFNINEMKNQHANAHFIESY